MKSKESRPAVRLYSIVLDTNKPRQLCEFYAKLLGWECGVSHEAGEDWWYTHAKGHPTILFQLEEAYRPPVWPVQDGKQQQMQHLDFMVQDLEAATAYAISLGAKKSPYQSTDRWNVMFDPSGHTFCLIPPPPKEQ